MLNEVFSPRAGRGRHLNRCLLLVAMLIMPALTLAAKSPVVNPLALKFASNRTVVAAPRLFSTPDTVHITALLVEFQPDTLSTTTGDGSFNLDSTKLTDYDRTPHNRSYFNDQLTFQRFYWEKVSGKHISLDWTIWPPEGSAPYRLPHQMWHYNHNDGSAQVDYGLAELVRDAVAEADSDAGFRWNNYHPDRGDVLIIFHAGSGTMFDVGYTTTPHDIPSASMVLADFGQLGATYSEGIPTRVAGLKVTNCLILPETETRPDVDASVAGVITFLLGHSLGLPQLYDRDDGDAVVGKWSMMDRGFGNFHGAIPSPVDAWSASKMGWLNLLTPAGNDTFRLHTRFVGEDAAADSVGYRIALTDKEEFVVESRLRDPDHRLEAIAYDRNGKRMVMHDDYTVSFPDGTFKVPVRVDDLDFDSPGSGILIWHHDAGLDALIGGGRFNSVDGARGLDLEEADGAQDIGQGYDFLTPGYGTDYGIFEDAWYANNEAHISANKTYSVQFNDNSFPNSRTNDGSFSHIRLSGFPRMDLAINNFHRADSVMRFAYANTMVLHEIATPSTSQPNRSVVGVGNFDDEPADEEFVVINDSAYVYQGDCAGIATVAIPGYAFSHGAAVSLVKDVNGDYPLRDEVVFCTQSTDSTGTHQVNVNLLRHNGTGFEVNNLFHSPAYGFVNVWILGGGGAGYRAEALAVIVKAVTPVDFETVLLVLRDGMQTVEEYPLNFIVTEVYRLGGPSSDTLLLFDDESGLHLTTPSQPDRYLGKLHTEGGLGSEFFPPVLADFDGSGTQDVLFVEKLNDATCRSTLFKDVQIAGLRQATRFQELPTNRLAIPFLPIVPNGNDGYRALSWTGSSLAVTDQTGLLVETTPMLPYDQVDGFASNPNSPIVAVGDMNQDRSLDFLYVRESVSTYDSTTFHYVAQLNGYSQDGQKLAGLPLNVEWDVRLCLITSTAGSPLRLLAVETNRIRLLDLGFRGNRSDIYWEGRYRDRDHSNAVWEPGVAYAAPTGSDLMPSRLCYNWPNPAKESTAIRYTLTAAGTVSATIYDQSGYKITELSGRGDAGMPGEIVWNLSCIERGLYFAVVEAKGGGRTQSKTIKIAVVK